MNCVGIGRYLVENANRFQSILGRRDLNYPQVPTLIVILSCSISSGTRLLSSIAVLAVRAVAAGLRHLLRRRQPLLEER